MRTQSNNVPWWRRLRVRRTTTDTKATNPTPAAIATAIARTLTTSDFECCTSLEGILFDPASPEVEGQEGEFIDGVGLCSGDVESRAVVLRGCTCVVGTFEGVNVRARVLDTERVE